MRALPATELLERWEAGLAQPRWEWARAMVSASIPALTPEELDLMTVGQRDRCLLDLREAIFGSQLVGRSRCPVCAESVDLTTEVALFRVEEAGARESTLDGPDYAVRVRTPNLGDLGFAARASDVAAMRDVLLDRCVVTIDGESAAAGIARIPESAIQRIVEAMAERDPQANLQLDLKCPACAHAWSETFDIVEFLWTELDAWAERLLGEVHHLATAYGWTEADVLALSPQRRSRYLDLIGT
ncbi:MAG: phage baseplate protein [Opitutus sp.]